MKIKRVAGFTGILVLALLVVQVVRLVTRDDAAGRRGAGRPPVAVEVDSVRFGPIRETQQLTGTVYPQYQYVIAPKVAGRIIDLPKRIGDWVSRGEVVARMDDAEYQQTVLEAEANLRISQASLTEMEIQYEQMRQELERVRTLQAKGIASSAEYDAAKTNFDALASRIQLAQAQVEQRQAALNSARIRLNYTVLKASEPGFVGERFVDEGALLAPNSAVIVVIGIETVVIRTTVIERLYGRMAVGQPAQVEVDAYAGRAFIGRVTRIAPMLQEASRVAQMEIEVANNSLILKPGMFARVTVVLAQKERAQLIPSRALINRAGTSGLMLIPTGQRVARWVTAMTGLTTLDTLEIVTPLPDGLVVTLGQHLLEDGGEVILPTRASKSTVTGERRR